MNTRSQTFSQRAFAAVSARQCLILEGRKKYLSFSRSFPTLIHTCGLAQASAFANAKSEHHADVLHDVAIAMGLANADALLTRARTEPVLDYLRLTREGLQAASWVKRYAEALLGEEQETSGGVTTSNKSA